MTTGNASEGSLVGLYVDFGGFNAFGRDHGSAAAAALRDRFVTRAMEIAGGHHMAAAVTGDDGMLFTSESEQAAMEVAFALTEQFAPDHPYFPIHVALDHGSFVETDDSGRTVRLTARITAAPHPGQSRPAERGTRTDLLSGS